MNGANLFEQQKANRRRSIALIAVFLAFCAWIGFGADLAFYLDTSPAGTGHYRHTIPWFGIAFLFLGTLLVLEGWRNGPLQVLRSCGAREILSAQTPGEQMLVNTVEEMAIASGVPRPRIWVIPDTDPNALATGIDGRAHLAVTEGLLATLDRDELQAVVAHEMSHIRNCDVRLMTLLASLVGVLALVSDWTRRILREGGRYRSGSSGSGSRDRDKNPLALIVLVLWLVSVVIAPLVSRLLALGVSRSREFLADATAAQFTRNPLALASALGKIETEVTPTRSVTRGSAHLCIADPRGHTLTDSEGIVANLFATHPPMRLRITRLKAMGYRMEKTGKLVTDI
jgi:heat shock protein HtpX